MFIPQLKKPLNDLIDSLTLAEIELERLKGQATPATDAEDAKKRLEAVELLNAERGSCVEIVCNLLLEADKYLLKLAETEFLLATTCPLDKQEIIEVPETIFPSLEIPAN